MKGLSLSGGGTKISAISGAAITILKEKRYKPDIISAISAGSIIAVPLAMGLYGEVKKYATTFTLDDIFDIKPVTSRGKISIRGIIRAIQGKESLGSQTNLLITLSNIITEERFKEYQSGNYPPCYLGSVEFKTGARKYVNVKDSKISYVDYLQCVLASSSIPVFVPSVKKDDGYYYDGGVRDIIGSHWLMENHDIKEHISIYARPEDYDITNLDWEPKNILSVLTRAMDIMGVEISKNDEQREDMVAYEKDIKNKKIFMPYLLATSAYQLDPVELKTWFLVGVKAAREQY